MKYSIITQIIVLAIAIAIGFFYIRPTFGEIGVLQDELSQLEASTGQVAQVNQTLRSKLNEINQIPTTNQNALRRYLPDSVDHIAILKDIQTISRISLVTLEALNYNGQRSRVEDPNVTYHTFSVGVNGEYEAIKTFMQNLEANNYPLHVTSMTIQAPARTSETEDLEAQFTLTTYALAAEVEEQ